MKECIAQETSIFDEASEKVTRNTALLHDARNMCEAFEANYNSAKTLRNDELLVLEEVRKIIDERLGDEGDISAKVREIGDQDAAEWDDYTNPFKLEPAQEFEGVDSGDYNEAGAALADHERDESLE
jgi:hypothetical protein